MHKSILTLISGLFILTSCALLETPRTSTGNWNEFSDKSDNKSVIKKRLLLLKFENLTQVQEDILQEAIAGELKSLLTDRLDLVLVDSPLSTSSSLTSQLGKPTEEQLLIARGSGIDALVTGVIKEAKMQNQFQQTGIFENRSVEAKVKILFKVTDVLTRREVFSKEFTSTAHEERLELIDRSPAALGELSRSAVTQGVRNLGPALYSLSNRIAWSGRIAKTEFQRYYVSGGRQSGLYPNLLLKVYSPPEEVKEKTSGQSLGFARGRFKGFLKIIENFGDDASVAVLHLGGGFKEEDLVEPHYP